jgi:hypothetical protein
MRAREGDPATQTVFGPLPRCSALRLADTTPLGKADRMTSPNIYRVRFTQSQRYAINISAPSAELAEFFAEEIRKKAAPRPSRPSASPSAATGNSEEICAASTPDLLAAVASALEQLRRGGPRWTIEESLANALARAKAQGSVS